MTDTDEIVKRSHDVSIEDGAKHGCFNTNMIHENPARFFSALPFERCKDCKFCFSPKNNSNTFICAEGMEVIIVGGQKNDIR